MLNEERVMRVMEGEGEREGGREGGPMSWPARGSPISLLADNEAST